MISATLKLLVIALLLTLSKQDSNDVEDKVNAFADVAQSFLQDQNIGSLVNNLVQSESGKQLSSMLMGAVGNGAMEGKGFD